MRTVILRRPGRRGVAPGHPRRRPRPRRVVCQGASAFSTVRVSLGHRLRFIHAQLMRFVRGLRRARLAWQEWVTRPVIVASAVRWAGLVTVVVHWGLMLGWVFWQLIGH